MSHNVVAAIVAMDEGRVIGKDGALPWHLPEDLAHFREQTQGQIVIMGRKTWDSLPARFRPLPGRTNIVVSRNPEKLELPVGVCGVRSVDDGVREARGIAKPGQIIWVIGGGEIYSAALPLCEELHVTIVPGNHDGDAQFPGFEGEFVEISARPSPKCTFKVFKRRAH